MIAVQNQKMIIALRPQLADDGAFANNAYWDRAGWNHERVLFVVGDTDIASGSGDSSTAPFVEECDTVGGEYTPVTGAALAAVIGALDDNKLKAIDIDLRKTHKRYGRVNAPTAGDGTLGVNLAIVVILSDGAISPCDAAGMGLTELVNA